MEYNLKFDTFQLLPSQDDKHTPLPKKKKSQQEHVMNKLQLILQV